LPAVPRRQRLTERTQRGREHGTSRLGRGAVADATVAVRAPRGALQNVVPFYLRQPGSRKRLSAAAEATQGKFYTILSADDLLEDLPSGYRVSMAAPMPPLKLWNRWLAFVLVMFLLTSE
jgi:hypothetical protein